MIGSTAPPNALENRNRIRRPPTETWTVWRSVASASTRLSWVNGGGGMLCGSVSCGIDVHVVTQRSRLASARATVGTSAPVAARPRKERLRISHVPLEKEWKGKKRTPAANLGARANESQSTEPDE
ncbi:hypothetical protein AB0M48_02700 [Lentzea sp. NPDC051208]|uniref:hypothetical protein n=1 Tax=Lentzea sp. NPDC051208 TaxID=3154642 RepID=UPI00341CAC65